MDFAEPLVRKMFGGIPPLDKSNPHYVTKADIGLDMLSEPICLYHADCFDGTGAAWALTKRFPHAKCIPVNYNEAPPLDQIPFGAVVYVVDFCYPIDDLLLLSAISSKLHVYDHHAGQAENIELYNQYMQDLGWADTHRAYFDNAVSGAKLTWQKLMPDHEVPMIIEHISDRDLWNFELEETKAVMAGLGTFPLDLVVWERLFRWDRDYRRDDHGSAHQAAIDQMENDGIVILRGQQNEINRIIKSTSRKVRLESWDDEITLINVPRHLASEALAQIATNEGIAAGYFDEEDHRVFSLRSVGDVAVNVIAKQYPGGGGHRTAAGFRLPRTHPLAQF